MKALGSFKNRRLAHAVRNHAAAKLRVAQIGIMFNQCRHGRKVLVKSPD